MKLLNKTLASLLFLISPVSAYVPPSSNIVEDHVYIQDRNYIHDATTGNLRMDVIVYWDWCHCNRINAPIGEHLRVVDWRHTKDTCLPTFDLELKKYIAEFKDQKYNVKRKIISTYFDISHTDYDKERQEINIHSLESRRKLRKK